MESGREALAGLVGKATTFAINFPEFDTSAATTFAGFRLKIFDFQLRLVANLADSTFLGRLAVYIFRTPARTSHGGSINIYRDIS